MSRVAQSLVSKLGYLVELSKVFIPGLGDQLKLNEILALKLIPCLLSLFLVSEVAPSPNQDRL